MNVINDIAKSNNVPAPVLPPALNMNLRMGEGTGALLAIPLLRSACTVVADLATLNEVLGL
jgi:NaMN:DMB phosphoribosyltransferase